MNIVTYTVIVLAIIGIVAVTGAILFIAWTKRIDRENARMELLERPNTSDQ